MITRAERTAHENELRSSAVIAHRRCGRWRRVGVMRGDELPDKWTCRQNPDARYNSCEAPQARPAMTRRSRHNPTPILLSQPTRLATWHRARAEARPTKQQQLGHHNNSEHTTTTGAERRADRSTARAHVARLYREQQQRPRRARRADVGERRAGAWHIAGRRSQEACARVEGGARRSARDTVASGAP